MINFNHNTATARLNIYRLEKTLIAYDNTNSRLKPLKAGLVESLGVIIVNVSFIAESFFKGTCHFLASPFSNKYSTKKGFKMCWEGIALTVGTIGLILIYPLVLGMCTYDHTFPKYRERIVNSLIKEIKDLDAIDAAVSLPRTTEQS